MAASRIKGITVEIDGDTTGLSKALSSVNKEMKSATALQKISATGEKLQSVGDSISTVGTKLMPVTAGVVALGTAAVTTAANFETAMSSVEALISSSSTDIEGDMEKLEEAARAAGETTKFSATEAAEAMSYMGLAGWSADEMCESLSGILNLAAASEMDLATASDIVTDYLSAFGLTAADSEMLVDKMAYAMSNSNTSTEQLGEAYKQQAKIVVEFFDMETAETASAEMYISGYKSKREADSSYGGLWNVSFTLKEF